MGNLTYLQITNAFSALSNTNRFRIFRLLQRKPGLSITEIAKFIDIPQSYSSRCIKLLYDNGLVIIHKDKQTKHCFPTVLFDKIYKMLKEYDI